MTRRAGEPALRVDAVLFDMDGTLIDESRSYREAIRLTASFLLGRTIGEEEVDEIKRIPGLNNDWDATWALVARHRGGPPGPPDRASPAYARLRDAFQTYYLGDRLWGEISGETPPFPWSEPLMSRETPLVAPETLDRLRGLMMGIATSRPRVEALMALRQHGLDRYFPPEAVVALEDAPCEKPHPAPLLELVRRLGCRSPIYVGDTVNDALAAGAAGMLFVYVGADPLPDGESHYMRAANVNETPALLAGVPSPPPAPVRDGAW